MRQCWAMGAVVNIFMTLLLSFCCLTGDQFAAVLGDGDGVRDSGRYVVGLPRL